MIMFDLGNTLETVINCQDVLLSDLLKNLMDILALVCEILVSRHHGDRFLFWKINSRHPPKSPPANKNTLRF